MDARNGKSSRSRRLGRLREQHGLFRPLPTRSPRPIVLVVCDDEKTSVRYFQSLAKLLQSTIHLEAIGCGPCSAQAVIERALHQVRALKANSSKASGDKYAVWALIDLEGDQKNRSAATAAKTKGEKNGIGVALSDPCYELWTLLHLTDTGQAFANCKAVIDKIKQEWPKKFKQPFANKATADYGKIISDRTHAAALAKGQRRANAPSWTEVYKVIEQIEEFCNPDPPKP